jgi:probable O-glycosylation ligase (exosortase A-associated)
MKGLVITYALAIVGTIGSLRSPLIGLFVYVFFAILRPQFIFSFAGDLSGISFWVGIAMLAGWVLHRFGSWQFGRGRIVVRTLLAFVAWFAISSVLALDPARAYAQLPVLARFILPFLVGVTLLDSPTLRSRMMWAIVFAQGYVGFEMNLNYLRGRNSAAEGFGGMDNNCFAVSLIAALGPAIALGMAAKTWYERALAWICAALILHTTLLTFSRGGLVGMMAVLAVAFVLMPKGPKQLAAIAVVLLLAVRFTGPQLIARYSTTFASSEDRDASAESRLDLWSDCLMVAREYPVFGVGPANWRVIASQFGWPEGKSAHSVWMETAAEVGFLGSLLLLTFFVTAAVKLWPLARSQMRSGDIDGALAFGTVLSIVGFVVGGQFVSVPGLELPYYVVMIGTSILKTGSTKPAIAAVKEPAFKYHPATLRLNEGTRGLSANIR